MKKEKDIVEIVEDISAIGRALGVFLILSMQRPDTDVLDGAELLTEKERFLMKSDVMQEIQAPYLDLEKAKILLAPYKAVKKVISKTDNKKDVLFEVFEDEY